MTTLTPAESIKTITLGARTIRYSDVGSGPVLVFVHGVLVNSGLWGAVIPRLAPHFRCIAPDLPLGAHQIPLPADADQTPLSVAHLVADLIAALDLDEVTLIGNDTGGAICQLVIANRPAGITRLLLTNCDAFEAFFPAPFAFFSHGPRLLGEGFSNAFAGILRSRLAQRTLLATVSRSHFADADLDASFGPLLNDLAVRRDLHRFLAAVSNRYTLDAARAFAGFHHPVLLVWGANDPFFTQRLARRLQRAFPDARLELVGPSRAFVPIDQPAALADQIRAFVSAQAIRQGGRMQTQAVGRAQQSG